MTRNEATKLVELLYDNWAPLLVRHAYYLTGDRAVAEDLAQEAFMALYQKSRAGEDIASPRAWTLAVVRNQASKRASTEQRHPQRLEPTDALDLFEGPTMSDPEAEPLDVMSLLDVLTKREVEVLLLRLESRKYREIAAELGIGAKSVATLLARALRKLQAAAKAKIDGEYILTGTRKNVS